MQNEVLIKRNKEIHQDPPQVVLPINKDLQETNRQFQELNGQPLKDKEKAEERDRQKSVFFANMVHEIRTPVNAIKGFAELLQDSELPKEDQLKYSQIIYRRADDLINLINDLLDISRIGAGQLTIIEKTGSLKELFDELFEMFSAPAGQNKSDTVQLESRIELNHDQYLINTDFIRLKQVLVNLISNALKFTLSGHVLFGCHLTDNRTLQFYVEDTGIGIKPEMKALIFEPYKQVNDPCLVPKCNGTGLGLSIVKSLIRLMKGKIWVESLPGVGSTFYFTIPYKSARQNDPEK
jgi:signal transduction histidine kinase